MASGPRFPAYAGGQTIPSHSASHVDNPLPFPGAPDFQSSGGV